MSSAVGKTPGSPGVSGGSDTTSRLQRAKDGLGAVGSTISSAASGASEWRAVKTVRESTVWSWITWPFSAIGSLLSGIWARISKAVWGAPKTVKTEVTVEFPGYLWSSSETTTVERAIRKGWLTIEKGMADKLFTEEDARVNGWVPVILEGRVWNSTVMLKTAIETGKMTVEQAIAGGHITEAQAAKANWIQKK